jgi:hypothetical protein
MVDVNWTNVAVRFCGGLHVPKPPDDRGWITAPEHPGVTAIYLPQPDSEKLKKGLGAQGINLLGTAHHEEIGRGSFLVAVVQSTDTEKIRAVLEATRGA